MEIQTSSLLCIFSYNRNFVGRGGRGGFGGGRGYYDRGPPESVTGRLFLFLTQNYTFLRFRSMNTKVTIVWSFLSLRVLNNSIEMTKNVCCKSEMWCYTT